MRGLLSLMMMIEDGVERADSFPLMISYGGILHAHRESFAKDCTSKVAGVRAHARGWRSDRQDTNARSTGFVTF